MNNFVHSYINIGKNNFAGFFSTALQLNITFTVRKSRQQDYSW